MNDQDYATGFRIPIHRAMTEPMLTAGVPRNFAILNWGVVAAVVLGMKNWWALPIGIAVHVIAKLATKYDPQWFEVMIRHVRYQRYYEG